MCFLIFDLIQLHFAQGTKLAGYPRSHHSLLFGAPSGDCSDTVNNNYNSTQSTQDLQLKHVNNSKLLSSYFSVIMKSVNSVLEQAANPTQVYVMMVLEGREETHSQESVLVALMKMSGKGKGETNVPL